VSDLGSHFEATVYGANLHTELYLRRTETDALEVSANVGDQEATVVLNLFHVRELRLALQRYEALLKSEGVTQ
jgi:hypothetical protein